MMLCNVFAWFLTVIALTEQVYSELQCSVPGQCADSDLIQFEIENDKYACHQECQNIEECNWFTFNTNNNFCSLFATCSNITEVSCNTCVTSQKDCDVYQCGIQGSCQGHLDHQQEADSEDQCMMLCRSNQDCHWYTFQTDIKYCLIFETCPTIDEACSTCVSGEKGCSESQISTKILVTTGYPYEESRTSEVIDLSNPPSECNDFGSYPIINGNIGAVGGLLNGTTPFICGGDPADYLCYFLGDPDPKAVMKESRERAAALVTNDGTRLWVTGGIGSGTTEYVNPGPSGSQSVYGPDLPESRHSHCLVQFDQETYMVIGGYASSGMTSSTYFFHVGNQSWTEGPELSIKRSSMSCQVLETPSGTERVVLVAGGASSGTEQIETWAIGSNDGFVMVEAVLPNRKWICCAASIVTADQRSMIIVGGKDQNTNDLSSLVKVTCNTATDCQVEVMEQQLEIARQRPLAMLVPDSIVTVLTEKFRIKQVSTVSRLQLLSSISTMPGLCFK